MPPPHLTAWRADAPGPPVGADRGPAREEAERELSRPMYERGEPSPVRRALTWLWDNVFGLFDDLAVRTPGGWFGLLVVVVLVAALVTALWLRLGSLRNAAGPRAEGALFTDRPRTAAEHRAAADEHARAARWVPAVQERTRALVRSLEERALLDTRPGRTATEAAGEAGRHLPALAGDLVAAASTFDAVTYGDSPADAADYARLTELDDRAARTRPRLPATEAAR
ncbi:DUF4129 domain-containing protein [Streptomyces avicenniae]|uniref:DUF4129 domain-containing protein n=1 Tax=Streptomyces avicenniae TaxID=500153 RepID=UPI00069BC04F|nr:DUF4129 domain-containing protein [Streptomyces avicenniae]